MYYLLFFCLTYCLIFAYFLKKLEKLSTSFIYLCLLPIFFGIADYLENFGIIKMLNNSAGGQVLHRFTLIHPNSKADRILASNAGSYKTPDIETNSPLGLKNIDITNKSLKISFKKDLVLFLG